MKKGAISTKTVASIVATTVTVLCTGAAAQEAVLEEIIVTAQKRAENIQDVPIAISAFTSTDLQRMGAVSMEQVARNTPNLFFNQSDSIKSSRTNIRGISAVGNTAGADPSVGYYLDEVYLGAAVGNAMDLYDVERIEVLRGPQGTLFGRNTVGGVVSVTSKRPSDEFEASVNAQFGNYAHKRIRGSISGPVVDGKLAVSISGVYFDREGFLYNENLKRDTNDVHQTGARISFLLTPNDRAEFLLSLDTRRVDQTAQSQETLVNNSRSTLGALGLLVNKNPTDRVVYSGFIGKEELKDAWGASLRGKLEFDSVDLISVTGYRTHAYYVEGESDQVPFGIGRNFDPEQVDRFTQELRLESKSQGAFNWIAGAYYYKQDSSNDGGILIENDLLKLFGAGFLGTLRGGSIGKIDAESTAAFASLEYAASEKMTWSFGGRYTTDKKSFSWTQADLEAIFGDPILGGTGSAKGSDKWSQFTPAATARYKVNDDTMWFASVSKGFKGGGYNDGSGIPRQQSQSYNPETMMNYEVGVKSTVMDGRMRLNASAFAMRWKDIQVRADDPSTPNSFDPRITNAGKAHSNGLEVEVEALITDNFRLEVNGAILDSGYDKGEIPVSSGPKVPLKHFTRAPNNSLGINAEYTVPVGGATKLTLRGEYQHQAATYLNVDPRDVYSREPGYGLLNARVVLAEKDDKWHVALWGQNLGDETYRVAAFDLLNNPLVGQYFSMLGAPRTYGVELYYGF